MSSSNEETNNVNNDNSDSEYISMESNSNASNDQIGYCHTCDRQVSIDRETFTCNRCNGGFIELFEMDQPTPQQQSSNPSGIRVDSMRLNQPNLANLLPMLIPQLLNARSANQHQQLHNQHLQQHLNQHQQNINQQQGANSGTAPSGSNSQTSSGNNSQSFRQPHGATRLQFIVPGEQFDLYGDVLDPRRQGGGGGGSPQQFHFQAPPIRMFQLHGDLRDYAWGPTGLDSIITQLLNQLENTGPPPATDEQLKNIPIVTIGHEEVEKNVQCAVCMEDFQLNDKAKKLPCKHHFHEPCISEWLKLHGTCPVCRKTLAGEDTSQREYVSSPLNNPNSNNSETATSTSNNNSNNSSSNSNSNNRNNSNTNYYEPDFD